MFFKNSRPDRAKRAGVRPELSAANIPPAKPYALLTEDEIRTGGNRTLIFDVESYPNYFEVGFKCTQTGKVFYFEDGFDQSVNRDLLGFVLFRFLLIGFNSRVYDLPMLGYALDGVPAWKLKEYSNELILAEEPKYDLRLSRCNHIDLIDVAPITASLKIYSGRLHCPRMQDLPYSDTKELTREEATNVRDYNLNDLDNTHLLGSSLADEIALRIALSAEYEIDLRSKSDAQVAEAVIISELAKLGVRARKPTIEPGKSFRFTMPPGLAFSTEHLRGVLDEVLKTNFVIEDNGSVKTPQNLLDLNIRVDKLKFQMGNGGLHSNEKSVSYFATNELLILDRDVASYYPAILINQKLEPNQLPGFMAVFHNIVGKRLAAKQAGRKVEAASLKIVINGIIGKLSNQYSKVYAPEVNTQITVSGQLYLLMLIEMLTTEGFEVVSANTDGVVTIVPKLRKSEFDTICSKWEEITGFVTEETSYRSLHARDVNNYIAIKPDGTCKVKGAYSELGSAPPGYLSKNPESLIVTDALQAYLAKGLDIEQTVRSCVDIRRFINVRQVKGGAYKSGTYLGKAIRWYYSTDLQGETIQYVLSGNNVPKSEAARPCMDLPKQLPSDLNFDYYINEAYDALYDLGVLKKPQQESLL